MTDKPLTAGECARIERRYKTLEGITSVPTEMPALLASYRAAMELLRAADFHSIDCGVLYRTARDVCKRTDGACTCGLAKRQAAIAAYDASPDQAGRGHGE